MNQKNIEIWCKYWCNNVISEHLTLWGDLGGESGGGENGISGRFSKKWLFWPFSRNKSLFFVWIRKILKYDVNIDVIFCHFRAIDPFGDLGGSRGVKWYFGQIFEKSNFFWLFFLRIYITIFCIFFTLTDRQTHRKSVTVSHTASIYQTVRRSFTFSSSQREWSTLSIQRRSTTFRQRILIFFWKS